MLCGSNKKQSTENKVEGRNFFYAQLGHAGQVDDPKAIKWMASKRETPAEMKCCSGKLDIAAMRSASIHTLSFTAILQFGARTRCSHIVVICR